jgi:lipopolysaccharide export LptBFGC system permease protein LptF
MNNIFVNQPDPLLNGKGVLPYPPQMMQYYQQNVNDYISKDWLGELDNLTKNLSEDELAALGKNSEYIRLSTEIQQNIQNEIMVIIKNKLNSRGDIIENVKKQMYIINEVKEQTNNEQRKSMAELNDYMKNYSHLTFQQYKNIKNGVKVEIDTPEDDTVVATVNNNTVKSKKK